MVCTVQLDLRYNLLYYFLEYVCPAGMLEMLIGTNAFTRLCAKYVSKRSLKDKLPLYLNY